MGFAECVRHPAVQLCIRVTRWLPVVFIVVVICWSYYAYVVELCFFTVDSIVEKVLYLIPYHVILFLFLWSYYQTTFADVLEPPKHFAIPGFAVEQMKQSSPSNQRQILEGVAKDLPVYTRSFDGSVRFCEKCNVVKPDRSHHCAICGVCVLKMDHHCPWVNTCVHYNNYKFFVLFLGYALLFCLFVFLTDLQYFIKFWTDNYASKGGGKFHIMFLFFVSGMFAISVSSLFFYHLWLTAKNRSTLESFRPPVFVSGPDKNGFNLGCGKNFQQIFGKFSVRAFVPLFTSPGDGSTYPVRSGLLLTQNGPPNSHSPPPHVEEEGRASSRTRPDDLSHTQFHILNDGGYELNGVISASGSKDNESSWMNDFPNAGDGTRFPSKTIRFDEEELLRHGSRWTDETDESSASEYENGRANGFRLSSNAV